MPSIPRDELDDLLDDEEGLDLINHKRNVRKEKKELNKKRSQSYDLEY